MKSRMYLFVLIASLLQQLFQAMNMGDMTEYNFLSGVPEISSVGYHMLLFGYWYLPIFFILLYFAGYADCRDKYQIITIVRYRTRGEYFIRLSGRLMAELLAMTAGQFIIYSIRYLLVREIFGRTGMFDSYSAANIITFVLNYFFVLLLLILAENLLYMISGSFNWNMAVNILIIVSVFMYNYGSGTVRAVFRWVNVSMYERAGALHPAEYICIVLSICILYLIMYRRWKRTDLLGGTESD